MTKVALVAFNKIMVKLGILEHVFDEIQLTNLLDHCQENSLLGCVKSAWADMGDNISLIYSGTGASTTQITKTGKPGKMGSFFDNSLRGVQRYI
jgi:hypothetical protein